MSRDIMQPVRSFYSALKNQLRLHPDVQCVRNVLKDIGDKLNLSDRFESVDLDSHRRFSADVENEPAPTCERSP